jgi:hypothetical protein
LDLDDNITSVLVEPGSDVAAPHKKPEDTSEWCRSLAKDDRDRADAADSANMRFRLVCSAEAWTARAKLLERLEGNRARKGAELGSASGSPSPERGDGNG